MARGKFVKKRYICPICGKRAVFGSHYCDAAKAPPQEEKAGRVSAALSALVAALVILALIWGIAGRSTFAVVGAGLLLAGLVAVLAGLSGRSRAYRELLRYCNWDREKANYQISREKQRNPGLSRRLIVDRLVAEHRREASR